MLFNGGKLAGNEPMDRKKYMYVYEQKNITPVGCVPSLLVYTPVSQVSVYRTTGPLVPRPI